MHLEQFRWTAWKGWEPRRPGGSNGADGAIGAARISYAGIGSAGCDLAILVSCVGRKLALGPRVEEEVEGVREVLGEEAVLTGFYSYGEISPFTPHADCALHNQTMTITTLTER